MFRSIKKGPFVSFHILANINSINKKGGKRVIYTWARSSIIIPVIIGHTVSVYNGNHHVPVFIKDLMVGHKLGEFSRTRVYSTTINISKSIKRFKILWVKKFIQIVFDWELPNDPARIGMLVRLITLSFSERIIVLKLLFRNFVIILQLLE